MSRFLIKVVEAETYYKFKVPKIKGKKPILDGKVYWAERIGKPKVEHIYENKPWSDERIMAATCLKEAQYLITNHFSGKVSDLFPALKEIYTEAVYVKTVEVESPFSVIVRDKNGGIIKILSSCQYTFVDNHKEQSKVLN